MTQVDKLVEALNIALIQLIHVAARGSRALSNMDGINKAIEITQKALAEDEAEQIAINTADIAEDKAKAYEEIYNLQSPEDTEYVFIQEYVKSETLRIACQALQQPEPEIVSIELLHSVLEQRTYHDTYAEFIAKMFPNGLIIKDN